MSGTHRLYSSLINNLIKLVEIVRRLPPSGFVPLTTLYSSAFFWEKTFNSFVSGVISSILCNHLEVCPLRIFFFAEFSNPSVSYMITQL